MRQLFIYQIWNYLFDKQTENNQGWAKRYTVKSNKIKSLYDHKVNSYYFICEPVNRS